MSQCECAGPGFCNRNGRDMPPRLHFLCQTHAGYRDLFEKQNTGEKRPPIPPSEQIKSFLSSTATFLHNGAQVTPTELHDQRLAICRTCEEMKPGKVLGVALPRLDSCNVCGCFVTLKAAYPHEKCPVGLWDSVSTGKGCGGCGG